LVENGDDCETGAEENGDGAEVLGYCPNGDGEDAELEPPKIGVVTVGVLEKGVCDAEAEEGNVGPGVLNGDAEDANTGAPGAAGKGEGVESLKLGPVKPRSAVLPSRGFGTR